MRISKMLLIAAVVAIAVLQAMLPTPAPADTYQTFKLVTDAEIFFYGMDDSGTVVFNGPAGCAATCYQTYVDGVFTGFSITPPNLVYDNGTPCSPTLPPPGMVLHGVCNNGRDAFTGMLTATQHFDEVYTGPDTDPAQVTLSTGGGFLFLNAHGDVVFDDTVNENWSEAIDLTTRTTPEPESIFLLGTGALAALGVMRKPLFR